MSYNSKTTKQDNGNFDYFYTLLKNWKTIGLVCFVAVVIAVISLLIFTQPSKVKSSFTVSLDRTIQTDYGNYKRNSVNPEHYVTTLEQESFIDSVLSDIKIDNKEKISLKVEAEEVKQPTDRKTIQYPYKFDLIVSGSNENELVKVNAAALDLFQKEMDNRVLMEMSNQFLAHKKLLIKNLKLGIQLKTELIENLNKSIENSKPLDLSANKDLVSQGLLNNFEDSERGIIISMLLNQEQGKDYYYNAMISIEKVSLKKMVNTLEKEETRYKELQENYQNGTLENIFVKPFSENFSVIQKAEEFVPKKSSAYLRRLLIALFLGFAVSTTIVLIRAYYSEK